MQVHNSSQRKFASHAHVVEVHNDTRVTVMHMMLDTLAAINENYSHHPVSTMADRSCHHGPVHLASKIRKRLCAALGCHLMQTS